MSEDTATGTVKLEISDFLDIDNGGTGDGNADSTTVTYNDKTYDRYTTTGDDPHYVDVEQSLTTEWQ